MKNPVEDNSMLTYDSIVMSYLIESIQYKGNTYIEKNYSLSNPQTGRIIRLDLVELNEGGDIIKVYDICTPYFRNKKENLNTILKQLRLYKRITNGAEVFLVSYNIDSNKKFNIDSLEQIEKEAKKSKFIVSTFSNFYVVLSMLSDICKKDMEVGSKLFFRGQPNNEYEPIPSIYRRNDITREDRYYHEAIRRKPTEFSEDYSTFDNLVKMQHYELPTRLLDITKNPLVALFFACLEAKNDNGDEADGEVLVYPVCSKNIKFYDSDSVCILANLAKQSMKFDFDKDKNDLVYDIKKERPSFDGNRLEKEAINKVFCVLPKLNNERIIRQDGAFFIFGEGLSQYEPAELPGVPYIITIIAGAKKRIKEELDVLGINEASLFPETDKVMQQIKREFM